MEKTRKAIANSRQRLTAHSGSKLTNPVSKEWLVRLDVEEVG